MKRHVVTLVLASMLAPGLAHADCVLKDVAGKSHAYAFGENSVGEFSVSCTLSVSNAGVVKGNCKTSLGVNGPISEGQIELANAKTCLYKGSFSLGSGITATITEASLSPEKTVLSGVGVIVDGPFLMTAIKTP